MKMMTAHVKSMVDPSDCEVRFPLTFLQRRLFSYIIALKNQKRNWTYYFSIENAWKIQSVKSAALSW